MPQLGETVHEGTVLTWYKKPNDQVQADEPLFEVETEKVTMEISAPASGTLSEILVEPGVLVEVGARLAIISVAAEPEPAGTKAASGSAARVDAQSESGNTNDVAAAPSQRLRAARSTLSPLVRRLISEHHLKPESVSGTGKNGRITPKDVLACAAQVKSKVKVYSGSAVSVGVDDYTVSLSRIRRVTAAHMVRSKATSPHTLQAMEVDFHAVEKARRSFGAQWQAREGFHLTILPFIARAVCESIRQFPYVNASFGNDELIVHKRTHLGIAVDLNLEGLAVTVIRDAHERNLRSLAVETHRLADNARRGKLVPDELTGGTYTISNSGSFGTFFSAPIINQPQVAILSTDGVRKKPWVIETPDCDAIEIRPIGVLAQSFDHRAFDGAYSASFLRHLKGVIETTDWLLELESFV